MRKVKIIAVLLIGILAIAACKSQPPTDQDFRKVYDRFHGGLILEGATTYTVKSGDTLAAISRGQYQDGFYYPVIMLASRDVVLDPDKIEPGMKLIVPDLQRNLDNSRARSNIKSFLFEIAKLEANRGRADTAKGIRARANTL
jgi:hypothetical protein